MKKKIMHKCKANVFQITNRSEWQNERQKELLETEPHLTIKLDYIPN